MCGLFILICEICTLKGREALGQMVSGMSASGAVMRKHCDPFNFANRNADTEVSAFIFMKLADLYKMGRMTATSIATEKVANLVYIFKK